MGYTPFGLVAGNGPSGRGGGGAVNLALMDLLAKHRADVNAKIRATFHIGYGNQNDGVNSKEGTSALHEAARNAQVDVVKHLIDLGANPNLLDGEGLKPTPSARFVAQRQLRRTQKPRARGPVVPARLQWPKSASF